MNKRKPRFLRSDTVRHIRLGKKKKSLQKWRKARGRHSKIRRKRVGYPVSPSIGYGRDRRESGLIKGKTPVRIMSLSDLNKLDSKNHVAILSRRIGAKKRLEVIKLANEKKIDLNNVSGGKNENR